MSGLVEGNNIDESFHVSRIPVSDECFWSSLWLFCVLCHSLSCLEDNLNIISQNHFSDPCISFAESVSSDCLTFHNRDLNFSLLADPCYFGKLFYWAVRLWSFFLLLSPAAPSFIFWGHLAQKYNSNTWQPFKYLKNDPSVFNHLYMTWLNYMVLLYTCSGLTTSSLWSNRQASLRISFAFWLSGASYSTSRTGGRDSSYMQDIMSCGCDGIHFDNLDLDSIISWYHVAVWAWRVIVWRMMSRGYSLSDKFRAI